MDSPVQEALTRMIKWILHVELRSLINDADEEERINRRQNNSRVLVEQPRTWTSPRLEICPS